MLRSTILLTLLFLCVETEGPRADGPLAEVATSRFFRDHLQWTQRAVFEKFGVPPIVEVSGAGSLSWRYPRKDETCFLTFVNGVVVDAGVAHALDVTPRSTDREALGEILLEDYRTVTARRGLPLGVGIARNGAVTWRYRDSTVLFLDGIVQDERER